MRARTRTLLGIGSALAVTAAPQAAIANNFGSSEGGGDPHNEVSLGNNRWHSYSFHFGGTQAWRDALLAASEDAYDSPTDVVTSGLGNGQNTDVRVAVGSFGTGFNGWVDCPSDATRGGTDPSEWCWNQWLKIDTSNAGGFSADRKKSLMCHEFGHTLGLLHTDSGSCMTPSSVNPNRSTLTDAHDQAHLNDNY